MPESTFRSVSSTVLLCVIAIAGGCDSKIASLSLGGKKSSDTPKIVIPPHVKGTVAQYAGLAGAHMPVKADGVVVGLGDKGSAEVPTHLRNSIRDYLLKRGLESHRRGTERVTRERFLGDMDTAVVLVGGEVPLGAPAGTAFDLFVGCPPDTDTTSLDGGVLMPIDLSLAPGGISLPSKVTKELGSAGGAIFVNPFVDPNRPEDSAKLRTGRIIGGGIVTVARPIRLQLRQPSYPLANRIRLAIVERFDVQKNILLAKVAKARNRSVVELEVPPAYHQNYRHFLDLVMHLPVQFGTGSADTYARRIADHMEMPTAEHHELALVLEAMGRQMIPLVRRLYSSSNPAAAFYAGRTGIRLGDDLAAEVILRFATMSDSPFQIPAIEELAQHRDILRAGVVLRELINDTSQPTRLAAYEALRKRGDRLIVKTIHIAEDFEIDLVSSSRSYTIYAAQTGKPRIALFGKNMPVRRPVFFESLGGLVTVNAQAKSDKLTVFRKIPRNGMFSDPFDVDSQVRSLIETLGRPPRKGQNGKIMGLGLTYSQVVGVLYQMCQEEAIPAKFVLQPVAQLQRIYSGTATVGRPDAPNR